MTSIAASYNRLLRAIDTHYYELLQLTKGYYGLRAIDACMVVTMIDTRCCELLEATTSWDNVWLLQLVVLVVAGIMHGSYNSNYKSTTRATEPPVNSNSGNEQLAIFPETLHIQSQGQGPAWIKFVFSTQSKLYLPLGLPIRCHGNFCKNAC